VTLCSWEGNRNYSLASHRLCVTDFVVYPPMCSMALRGRRARRLRSGRARDSLRVSFVYLNRIVDVGRVILAHLDLQAPEAHPEWMGYLDYRYLHVFNSFETLSDYSYNIIVVACNIKKKNAC